MCRGGEVHMCESYLSFLGSLPDKAPQLWTKMSRGKSGQHYTRLPNREEEDLGKRTGLHGY